MSKLLGVAGSDPCWPDESQQRDNLVIPCRVARNCFWGRVDRVCTLGEFFSALSTEHTAAALYWGYMHREVISVKRWKGSQALPAASPLPPPLPSAKHGLPESLVFRTAERKHSSTAMILDYCRVTGVPAPTFSDPMTDADKQERRQLLRRALAHSMGMLLRDLRPEPSLGTSDSTSKLQGVFRKTLLAWRLQNIAQIFGEKVSGHLLTMQGGVPNTHLVAVVGRPLLACGRPVFDSQVVLDSNSELGAFCTKHVAMTPLLEHQGPEPWVCATCKLQNLAPGFDSAKRLIRLYPYVAFAHGESILTLDSVVVVVSEPPSAFQWDQAELGMSLDVALPLPAQLPAEWARAKVAAEAAFLFDAEASRNVWLQAQTLVQLPPGLW